MIRILTVGTFDNVHVGHVNLIQQIKELFPDSFVVIALNRDEFVERFKGKKPLFSYEERKNMLKLIKGVDMVVCNFGDEDSKGIITLYSPNVIVIGNDWLPPKDYCKQMSFTPEWLRQNKITLVFIPYTDIISSSKIRKRLLSE